MELPVSLVFCFEGMEENESGGLHVLVVKAMDAWFMCLHCSTRARRRPRNPCSDPYMYYKIASRATSRPPLQRLRSYRARAMTGPFALMAHLVDPADNILVPGLDDVVSVADAEQARRSPCCTFL
ncbi:hypothetical protein B0H11DRAFT_2279008 [Mycena galericulata]|nr:hypothetical protein B0H11DRAFT_2279008 [Mycena galericulata]